LVRSVLPHCQLLWLLFTIDKSLLLPFHEWRMGYGGPLAGSSATERGAVERGVRDALMQALPTLAAALQLPLAAAAGRLGEVGSRADVATVAEDLCSSWEPLVNLAAALCESSGVAQSGPEVLQLRGAATQALRTMALLPAAHQLLCQKLAEGTLEGSTSAGSRAPRLALDLAGLAAAASDAAASQTISQLGGEARAVGPAALQTGALRLHEAGCRAVHWAAASEQGSLWAPLDKAQQQQLHNELLTVISASFWVAAALHPQLQRHEPAGPAEHADHAEHDEDQHAGRYRYIRQAKQGPMQRHCMQAVHGDRSRGSLPCTAVFLGQLLFSGCNTHAS